MIIISAHYCPSCGGLKGIHSKQCHTCHLKNKRRTLEQRKETKRAYANRDKHPCPDCGKPITKKSTRCLSCNLRYQWKEAIRTNIKYRKGFHNPTWKGGRMLQRGYVLVFKRDHPRANRGYVREHILVWEEAHGKPLPNGWIVHHLNGIKDDNQPQNLVALPNKKHYLVLQAKAKRIQELEALLNHQSQLL